MRARIAAAVAATAVLLAVASPASAQPTTAQCDAARAHRQAPAIQAYDPHPGAPRVFAMQYKQDIRNVVTYEAYRTKIECLMREYVVPRLAHGRPNIVAFNEDVGLMTLAIGSRGAAARDAFARSGGPGCESQGVPCTTLGALAAVTAAYSPQIAAYHARFPAMGSVSQAFVGATDTLVRAFMQTFSDLAREYGIYIVGSSDQAPFTQSSDPADIAAFSDPDGPRPASVYVATSPQVYNQVFMWGPHDVRSDGPAVLRNVVATNRKVPLTPIESELQLTPGPSAGAAGVANLEPYALPGTRARIGFATSLPAFVYGDPPAGTDPCSDTSQYYMRCLDKLGANLVIQAEANPGRWTGADGSGGGQWQPLSWMESTYRAASDPTVRFDYEVTPMMVGNLADLPFDGQSAITQRGGLTGAGCHYIGDAAFVPAEDSPKDRQYAGDQRDFLALAPWVSADGPRDALRAVGAKLAPGSLDPLENDYLETALVADLPFPVDSRRPACAGSAGGAASTHGAIRLSVRPRQLVVGALRRVVFRARVGGPLARVRVTFAGRVARTDARGRAVFIVRPRRAGRLVAVASAPALRRGTAVVSVVAARRARFAG